MELKKGAHIHLMGICGTAMASLAGLLQDLGYKITGSDQNPYPPMSTQLEKLGIEIMKGYSAKNLSVRPDFVIVGNVISASNEEAQELVRLGIPYTSLPKAMGQFIIDAKQSIVISGTHGKTTTSSMMAWVAEECGKDPGFMIGGIPKNFSQSFRNSKGDFFVIEGDEYDTAFFDKVPKFVHYRPRHVILTSVEFDHADIYANLEAVMSAFSRLMTLIPDNGTLVACADEVNVMSLVPQCKAKRIVTYGMKSGDYQAKVQKIGQDFTEFEVSYQSSSLGIFQIQMSGDYNVKNALSVIALSHQLGWNLEQVKKALKVFLGVKRRQEILGEPNGVLVIEDFAHHPTAVRETLRGLKSKYPQRHFFAVFEPRSATSRRKIFQKDYVEAFKETDEVLIAKAFDQTKIDETNRFSSEELVEDLKKQGKTAEAFDNADAIVQRLKSRAKSGDAVLIMSNGGFDGIYQKLLTALSQN